MAVNTTRRLRLSALVAAPALLGLALGCQPRHPDTAPPLPEGVSAWELITKTEAEQVAGQELAPLGPIVLPESGKDPTKAQFGTLPGVQPFGMIAVEVRYFTTPEEAGRKQQAARNTLGRIVAGRFTDVPGLGDDAVWFGGQVRQLHVLQGPYRLLFTVEVGSDVNAQERGERMAGFVLPRFEQLLQRLAARASGAATPESPPAGT